MPRTAATARTVAPARRLVTPQGGWWTGAGSPAFDGTDDKVTGSNNTIGGSAATTLAVWLRFRKGTATASAPFCIGEWSTDKGWSAYSWAGGVVVAGVAGRETTTGVIVRDGLWHRLVIIYAGGAGGRVQVYADGVWRSQSIVCTPNITTGIPSMIGVAVAPSTYPWGGWISDLRRYSRAWSLAEVQADWRNEWVDSTGLVKHWALDAISGGTTRERIGGTDDAVSGALLDAASRPFSSRTAATARTAA